LVEHTAENRGVAGSIPALATSYRRSSVSRRRQSRHRRRTRHGRTVTLNDGVNRVKEILDEKGHDVLQIEADASVFDAVKRMVEAGVGSLLVTEGGETAGIFTERDYLRRMTLEGRDDKETAVRVVMSSPLVVVTPENTIDECMAMMTDRRIRHLPVVEGGEVAGIVSIGDIVKFKSKQQSFEIKYLTDYITAR
jgi:signal-transduction protein with cAMP-binding, CBS, and nucleotidyltransferase domain